MFTIESAGERRRIEKAISVDGLSSEHTYLSYAGILPIHLPDGCRMVALPDMHIPAHDEEALWAIKKFLKRFRPHVLISIGDLADIYALSRHPKPLRDVQNPQEEFNETRRVWDELVRISGCYWSFVILGNHEDRVIRFIQDMAPALGGIVDPNTHEPFGFHAQLGYTADDHITFLYGTEERGGFEGGLWINGSKGMHHGNLVRPKPGASALGDSERFMRDIDHGHTHRFGMTARDIGYNPETNPTGVLRTLEMGNLVNRRHHYMAYAKDMFPNWHPGFGVYVVHDGVVHTQPMPMMPVKNARGNTRLGFVWNGELFTAA